MVQPPIEQAPVASAGDPEGADRGPPIHFHCELATLSSDGRLAVNGWVFCAGTLEAVTAWLDDCHLGKAELGLPREDVGRHFPAIASARLSGFRLVRCGPDFQGGDGCLRLVARSAAGRIEALSRRVERVPGAAAAPDSPPFRLEIDSPGLTAGAAADPVRGRLIISGWTVAHPGVACVEVLIDGRPAGTAHHGIPRQDVAAALPGWPDAMRSGFLFACPPRLLRAGAHEATLRVRAHDGQVFERGFAFTVRQGEGAEGGLTVRHHLSFAEVALYEGILHRLQRRSVFRLLIPLRAADDVDASARTVDALHRQRYSSWEAWLIATDPQARAGAAARFTSMPQARVIGPELLDRRLDGDALYVLLGPGDLPGADALFELAVATATEPQAEFFSCDESRISPASGEREPFHKPCFSPDLLLHANYIGRFWCARPSLLARVGATPRALLERGEYDLVLRCTEAARAVHHIPQVLCHRGLWEEGEASERAAVTAAAARAGLHAEIGRGRARRSYRLQLSEPVPGLVSVLIPTCAANGHIKSCLESLRAHRASGRIEIVCGENIGAAGAHWREWLRSEVDRVISLDGAFNWSRSSNRCAAEARGDFLLFLDDDTEFTEPGWLEAMLAHLARPGVGIVGPRLLYPDGRVQHAGMFLAGPGSARHAFRFAEPDDPGYFGLALTTRNVLAVTGACMLMRRSLFETLGGFDEAPEIINNDLDFCLRAHTAGHSIVYTPDASLIHHELASRAAIAERFDEGRFGQRWRALFQRGDPFFSPRLARGTDDMVPEEESAELVCARHPLFHRQEIARILAIKLDRIGDFYTAVPALHRLRRLFPAARIALLASPGLRDLAMRTGSIDAFIDWEFSNQHSGLGQQQFGAADFAALSGRLMPERFDLAIDLRKHSDTREVLRHTGARWLAGFDHVGQFAWLDIALDWEGDRSLQAKRGHVGVDLLNLVEAVGTATADAHDARPRRAGRSAPPRFLPRLEEFFDRPIVCVHPGAGSPTRQWPADRFAALIDLLVAKHGVRIVLIGSGDEWALADAILAEVADRSAVRSLIGEVALPDLPELIGACALFVGNNSGPQHMAASLGVPTVGIHSGVVDAAEWAPLGPLAVAVRRDMACSPCYLHRVQDCARGLACLTGLEPAVVLAACSRFLPAPAPFGAIPA